MQTPSPVLALWTIHRAGEINGPVQHCRDCGLVLRDNTDWFEGRVAVKVGNPAPMPWWSVGVRVGTDGTATRRGTCWFEIPDDRELQDDEQVCTPAEAVSGAQAGGS